MAAITAETADLLTAWTAVSSPSGDVPGLRRMAGALDQAFSAVGLTCKTVHMVGDGGELPVFFAGGAGIADPADPQSAPGALLLVGHLDTVLPAAVPRMDNDRLWATGSVDMKAGLAAAWGALRLLDERGASPPADLLLVVVPDEEVGGVISQRVMREVGARARVMLVLEPGGGADVAITTSPPPSPGAAVEPTDLGSEVPRETVVIGRRGLFTWRLDVHGRSGHAGNAYWQGRSALVAATAWVAAAVALSTPGAGPTVNPARLVAGDRGFVDDLGAQAALLGGLRQLNVIPDRAVVEGEARFLRADEDATLRKALADAAEQVSRQHQVEMTLTVTSSLPPLDPGPAAAALATRACAAAAAAGWQLSIETDRGGISFPNMLPDPKAVPTLDGLGPTGAGMHTREEWVDLGSLGRRIALLADLLVDPDLPR